MLFYISMPFTGIARLSPSADTPLPEAARLRIQSPAGYPPAPDQDIPLESLRRRLNGRSDLR